MPQLVWDQVGEKTYTTGVSNVVLFTYDTANNRYSTGVAWSGVTKISEKPSGAEANDFYADNVKYLSIRGNEDFAASIEAYTYPDEWAECDGSAELANGVYIGQQPRKTFGLAYKTLIGNDTSGNDYGYKLHLVYGCTASPSERSNETVNDSVNVSAMSWEIKTIPVAVTGQKPTSHLVIDSTKADATKLAAFETTLFGGTGESAVSTLPLPDAVKTAFATGA